MGIAHEPSTHAEVVALIQSNLESGDEARAIKYGYHMKTFGQPFKHYKAGGVYSGKFRGEVIKPSTMYRLLAILAVVLRRVVSFSSVKIDRIFPGRTL